MPKLISQKNLRRPPSSGYVLSSSVTGVRTWVDNKSVDVSVNGISTETSSVVDFSSEGSISLTTQVTSGISTVTLSDPTSSVFSIIGL